MEAVTFNWENQTEPRARRGLATYLLQLELRGEAPGHSLDEIGKGERSSTVTVRWGEMIMSNRGAETQGTLSAGVRKL